jgi:hypothetical protein
VVRSGIAYRLQPVPGRGRPAVTGQADGDGTLLAFSSTLELPAEFRTRVLAGWHWHLDALAAFLGGTPADLVNVTGGDQIHQRYA